MLRTVLASTTLAGLGLAVLALETDGLSAFTREAARRLAVAQAPRPLRPVRLRDGYGREVVVPEPGRPTLVEFVYTSCPTICVALGQSFARIQDRLSGEAEGQDVRLLSIAFDLERDDPPALAAYALAHGADPVRWSVAAPLDRADRDALLDAFGVVVIPDGEGGFVHNAALHLVDRSGRLARILDAEEIEAAIAFAAGR